MKRIYDLAAPAKLNLFLHITGQRADGYHTLQSAFMLIDWCDFIDLELRSDGQISREQLGMDLPADDLCTKAARLLQQFSGSAKGVHISLRKNIPSEAGMGGGSSDAATCLLAMNQLWNTQIPRSDLLKLALQLGADVPFFVQGDNAWVEGVGEVLSPINLPVQSFAVVKPSQGVATKEIFAARDLPRSTNKAIILAFAEKPYAFGVNDMQKVAEKLCPEITTALQYLENLGLQPKMTGSGSTVFAPCPQGFAFTKPLPAGFSARVCTNLERHPLSGWAF